MKASFVLYLVTFKFVRLEFLRAEHCCMTKIQCSLPTVLAERSVCIHQLLDLRVHCLSAHYLQEGPCPMSRALAVSSEEGIPPTLLLIYRSEQK